MESYKPIQEAHSLETKKEVPQYVPDRWERLFKNYDDGKIRQAEVFKSITLANITELELKDKEVKAALKTGDEELIQLLIKRHVSINTTTDMLDTAASTRNISLVKTLLLAPNLKWKRSSIEKVAENSFLRQFEDIYLYMSEYANLYKHENKINKYLATAVKNIKNEEDRLDFLYLVENKLQYSVKDSQGKNGFREHSLQELLLKYEIHKKIKTQENDTMILTILNKAAGAIKPEQKKETVTKIILPPIPAPAKHEISQAALSTSVLVPAVAKTQDQEANFNFQVVKSMALLSSTPTLRNPEPQVMKPRR